MHLFPLFTLQYSAAKIDYLVHSYPHFFNHKELLLPQYIIINTHRHFTATMYSWFVKYGRQLKCVFYGNYALQKHPRFLQETTLSKNQTKWPLELWTLNQEIETGLDLLLTYFLIKVGKYGWKLVETYAIWFVSSVRSSNSHSDLLVGHIKFYPILQRGNGQNKPENQQNWKMAKIAPKSDKITK